MHVHFWHRCLYGGPHVKVCLAGERWVYAALQAYLSGARGLRLCGSLCDLVEIEPICRSTQIASTAPLGERTEPALVRTDVGVVDIAVDHEGDSIAFDLLPQPISLEQHVR